MRGGFPEPRGQQGRRENRAKLDPPENRESKAPLALREQTERLALPAPKVHRGFREKRAPLANRF